MRNAQSRLQLTVEEVARLRREKHELMEAKNALQGALIKVKRSLWVN